MILRGVALWLALAAPALATVEGWPALHDVTGVGTGDVLDIRAAPATASEIVGSLAPDAKDIEVLEVNRAETWGRVNAGEATGWVAMDFLVRQPGQWAGRAPARAICIGTEPFWSLALEDEVATFETPDSLPLAFIRRSELGSRNRIDRFANVYENDLGGLVATLRNTACSDGMSDRAYGWEIDVLHVVAGAGNAQLFSGCCSISP